MFVYRSKSFALKKVDESAANGTTTMESACIDVVGIL